MNHIEYCNNNMARKNACYHVSPGHPPVYSLDGKIYSKEEFDEAFPISGKLQTSHNKKFFKGDNVDSTRNWIDK